MNLKICDICKMNDNKIVEARFRISFKNQIGKRIALDSCKEHQNFLKVCKGFQETERKIDKLYLKMHPIQTGGN